MLLLVYLHQLEFYKLMKNSFIYIILIFLTFQQIYAENLNIKSSNISVDKNTKITIFKDGVEATDSKNNIFKTDLAEYNKESKTLSSKGETVLITSEGFILKGENILFDNSKKVIQSNFPAIITDKESNQIFLQRFEYSTEKNFFRSTGNIKIIDTNKNQYNFSQLYIDEKKREIIGTDIKSFLNDNDFKINEKNKPRVFANAVNIKDQQTEFTKSIFTLCNYRDEDKCPPWSLLSSKMTHDKKKKTIYYDNAIVKVYDIPIFYIPKFSHPDPTVDRRSGFLPPSFSDSKNLGTGFEIPYYWAINRDKDFTLKNKLFASENPLFSGEYRQVFESSNLIFDFGYTKGYKQTSDTKKSGDKSHYFAKFVKNFSSKDNSESNLEVTFQEVSNDKYLKLYRIDSSLVDYQTDALENSFNFTHADEDLFFGFKASSHETLKETYNDKYEYILPDIVLDKNLFSDNKYGNADFTSNLKVHNYDTNKFTKFLVNDIDWRSTDFNYNSGPTGKLLGKLKNVNYEAKNTSDYKTETTSELFGALGLLTEIDMYKETPNDLKHLLTPKFLVRYSPGHMRKQEIDNGTRLTHHNLFSLDRLNSYNNFENGLSATVGFDYEIKNDDRKFDLVVGQVINEKENKDMPSSSSLDEKLSDVIGSTNLEINEKLKFNYNFALDQNYNQLNYNEIGTTIDLNPIKFNFNYLREMEHIGDQEYISTKIDLLNSDKGVFSAETKRNLITNSAEFYNLSYEYLNDCLKAGLVYRREFYDDSELESENSLMFKITLIPFGNLNSPSFNK